VIPAFVFFFDMLFPFGLVNDPKNKLAAAAGGCMLVRARRWRPPAGIASIRGENHRRLRPGARLRRRVRSGLA